MVVVEHLISPAALPHRRPFELPNIPRQQLSVLSYNVLLPNSEDGWWTYKMYMPPLPDELKHASSWDYRRGLLRKRIQLINADVVCLQEVSPRSFDADFKFMEDIGYDCHQLFKKGRFRPATFWKSTVCKLVMPAAHKDRCLITAFQPRTNVTNDDNDENKYNDESDGPKENWYICNCHLQAGKQAKRRVRQINEGMKGIMTMARKMKETTPEKSVLAVVCGDFNGGPESGAVRYLEDGYIDEHFVEDGESVSSGRKALPMQSSLVDTIATVERKNGDPPPPTMVVSELMSLMMEEATYDNPVMSQGMNDILERIFKRLATNPNGDMSVADVNNWLVRINREYGRGDEYREAAKQMGWVDPNPDEGSFEERKTRVTMPENGILSLDGFKEVYKKELNAGKFWGIAHDFCVLDNPFPDAGVFTARYDRIYHSAALQPIAVLDTLSDKPCPNENEPSDHLDRKSVV